MRARLRRELARLGKKEDISAQAKAVREVVVPRGRHIVTQGETLNACYFIINGVAELFRTVVDESGASHRVLLSKLSSGDCCGEQALLRDTPGHVSNVSVVAHVQTRVLRLDEAQSQLREEEDLRQLRKMAITVPVDSKILQTEVDRRRWNEERAALTRRR